MTIASENSRSTQDGNGSNKDFTVDFAFHEASTIEVILIDADGTEHVQTLATHYTVTGGISGGVAGTGTVKMITAPPSGSHLLIRRKPQLTQTFDPTENEAFPSSSIETALDRLVTQVQFLRDKLSRVPMIQVGSGLLDQLALPTPMANAAIGWNATANGLANVGSSASLSAQGAALVGAPSYASMRSLLDLEPGTDFLSPPALAASYQPLNPGLSALATLTSAADKVPYFTGSNAAALADLTSIGRTLMSAADARAICAAISTWHLIAKSGAAVVHTGTTSSTALVTVTVPAGAMGPTGILRVTLVWSCSNTGNNKSLACLFGGNHFRTIAQTTNISNREQFQIQNRNSQAAQVGHYNSASVGGWNPAAFAHVTSSVNTANAADLIVYGVLANAADTMTIESYSVELLYGS